MKNTYSVICCLLLVGCAVSKTKLSSGGKQVRILKSKSSAKDCNVIDRVQGMNDKGSEQLATNHARNLLAKMDANAILVNDIIPNGSKIVVTATGYFCEE